VFGDAHTHDRLVRELAVGTGAAVAFPEYDRSPEDRYQGVIHDFVMLNALRETHAADAAIRQAIAFLSEALAAR
jgi:acetyl esterase/lipase